MSDLTRAWQQLAVAQKSATGVSLYSKYLNRPLGRVLAVLAHGAGLSPNAVTAISAVTTLAGLTALVLLDPTMYSTVSAMLLPTRITEQIEAIQLD